MPLTTSMRLGKAFLKKGTSLGTTEARTRRCLGNFFARERIQTEVASLVGMSPVTRILPLLVAVAHLRRVLPASMRRKGGLMRGRLGAGDSDVLNLAGAANHLDGHGGAADFAILNGGVIALGGIGGGRDDFAAVGALDLDLDEHDLI